MNKQADYLIFHRVYEIGFCEYETDTTVFIDGEPTRFGRDYKNVTPEEAVNKSLSVASEYAKGVIGPDASCIIDSNGSPFVDWQAHNATQYEEDSVYE